MATDGNWSATKKFTAIVKGSLKGAERKAKKKDPTLEQSSALPNEVLKGYFGTTPKTSWIQVGEVVRFLDLCFLSSPA